MRMLFIVLIWVLATSDILDKEFSLGPGLSAKNALLYIIAFVMFFRTALSGGGLKLRLPVLHAAFAAWIFYAGLSFMACCLVVHYASYNMLLSGMELKAELIDTALFCFTVFYGVQGESDFRKVNAALAAAIGLSSILTLLDVAGVAHIGVRVGTSGAEADRVFGVFGHANETGALLVCLLPMLIAVALSARGPVRVAWFAGVLASVAVLVLTVSRGAFVGVVVGYGGACFLCRRYLPLSRVATWAVSATGAAIVLGALIMLVMPDGVNVVADRLFGHSTLGISEMSSGRTNVWSMTVGQMVSEPATLLTGFGWNVQEQRFVYATHNYYLNLWYNLGLFGLGAFVIILYQCVATARRAAQFASADMRRYMIAFVFGVLGMATAVFFTNLSKPWPYIWIYIGLTLRAAVEVLDGAESASASAPQPLSAAAQYRRLVRSSQRSATGAL